jgi:hypothetical protein
MLGPLFDQTTIASHSHNQLQKEHLGIFILHPSRPRITRAVGEKA